MYSSTVVFMMRWPHFRGTLNLFRSTRSNSSNVKAFAAADKLSEIDSKNLLRDNSSTKSTGPKEASTKSNLVASAFASLKNRNVKKMDSVDELIVKATTPEQLLNLVDVCKLSRRHALKIISILAEWSVTGEANMKDFERDSRFSSLCQTLGHPVSSSMRKTVRNPADDLTMVLNIKNDDEAAKIITTFTLQQMIRVLSSLALKKRRSVPLLRSLSFNIAQNSSKLNVKQGADILYALAYLNYPDEVLLEKVSADLYECIPKCQKTSVIGSIATSLGILRYKDIDLLDTLCEWSMKNLDLCRLQDLNTVLFTLAHVNHQPSNIENFIQDVRKRMIEADVCVTRLDVIWSLTILGRATHEDYSLVLSPEFCSKLKATYPDGLPVPCKKKLLNINGAAKLSEGYNGPLLEMKEEFSDVMTSRSKEKQVLVTSVFEALSNLLPSSVYLRTNINLDMGFNLDGECQLDSKLTPLPLVDRKTGEALPSNPKGTRIGILIWDYHEHTKGRVELCGLPSLYVRLVAASGYRILSIPYLDYNPKDKLINRVQYLEKNLKLLVHPR